MVMAAAAVSFISLRSVSYTHLDVYKRQGEDSAGRKGSYLWSNRPALRKTEKRKAGGLCACLLYTSQDLYGDECLAHVAEHSGIIVDSLNKSGILPYEVVWKPTLITNELIRRTFNEANAIPCATFPKKGKKLPHTSARLYLL